MKFKKLMMIEAISIIIIVSVALILVEGIPNLVSSSQPIGVYNQREYVKGEVTLTSGDIASAQFNYSSFDPAILVIDLAFQNWQTTGALTILCNGRNIATILCSPNYPTTRLTTISVSGWDWVKPPSINSFTYGNEVTFQSESQNGFEGTFNYQISIRGSR